MAGSRTPPPEALAAIRKRVAGVLGRAGIGPGARLLLGYSGGLDSTVLLCALAALREELGFALQAHHVHHGLSPDADAWARACARRCESLGVPLATTRVRVEPAAGEGWEAAARRLRHAAWRETPADWWVSAHHRDDQAETLLFRLLRGAGVHGAAAMREIEPGAPGRLRPLLAIPRAALEAAAREAALDWVEDESNADTRFTRNFLRHEVMPLLRTRFAGAEATLARAAGHFAEAAGLLDELAAQDAAACGTPFSRSALQRLGGARLANLLRWRLRALALAMPDEARLAEAMRQLHACEGTRPLRLPLGSAELHAYRDAAWITPPLPALPAALPWSAQAPVPWGEGEVIARPVRGGGLDAARLAAAARLEIVARRPGCRIKLAGQPHKTLRALGQELGLAPVERDRLPMLCVDGEVAWIAGVGVAEAFACPPDGAGLALAWRRPAAYSPSGTTEA